MQRTDPAAPCCTEAIGGLSVGVVGFLNKSSAEAKFALVCNR